MDLRKAAIYATILMIAVVGVASAANWYYSSIQSTTVVEPTVTLEALPATTIRNEFVTLQGNAKLGVDPLPGITVYLQFDNGSAIGSTTTDSAGHYTYNYNATEAAGTLLKFRAGINR